MTIITIMYRQLIFSVALLSIISLQMTFGQNFFEQNIDHYITDDRCHEAVLNCTNHWSMIPFIPPVGLCEEYFSIECMTELVVSSNCIDEPGYGEFLEKIAVVIEDCAKSGMRWTSIVLKQLISRAMKHILCHKIQKHCYNITTWNPQKGICDLNFPACIMRTYAEEYCKEFEDDLELEYYMCLSGATKCNNKREVINECEKEYLVEIRRITGEIDRRRSLATSKNKLEKTIG
uniref:Bm10596 n=5 Tax=Brugia TaxID=6278 RepID=A0A7I4K481_BRUMA